MTSDDAKSIERDRWRGVRSKKLLEQFADHHEGQLPDRPESAFVEFAQTQGVHGLDERTLVPILPAIFERQREMIHARQAAEDASRQVAQERGSLTIHTAPLRRLQIEVLQEKHGNAVARLSATVDRLLADLVGPTPSDDPIDWDFLDFSNDSDQPGWEVVELLRGLEDDPEAWADLDLRLAEQAETLHKPTPPKRAEQAATSPREEPVIEWEFDSLRRLSPLVARAAFGVALWLFAQAIYGWRTANPWVLLLVFGSAGLIVYGTWATLVALRSPNEDRLDRVMGIVWKLGVGVGWYTAPLGYFSADFYPKSGLHGIPAGNILGFVVFGLAALYQPNRRCLYWGFGTLFATIAAVAGSLASHYVHPLFGLVVTVAVCLWLLPLVRSIHSSDFI